MCIVWFYAGCTENLLIVGRQVANMLRALAHGRVTDEFGVGAMYSTILVILQASVGRDRVVLYVGGGECLLWTLLRLAAERHAVSLLLFAQSL